VLPIVDAEAFAAAARRTRLRWLPLVALLVALVLTSAALARKGGIAPDVLPNRGDTVVVIDLSGSTRSASKKIAKALLGVTRNADRKVGLVVFSDTGYEALPPATPVTALRDWLELFANEGTKAYPWTPSFSGGTVISTGLVAARKLLLHSPMGARHVLLVSDLVDGVVDLPNLQSIIAQYQREGIDLRVIKVRADTNAVRLRSFLQLPNADFIRRAATRSIDSTALFPPRSASATPLIVLVAVLAAVAALYELAFHPLSWRRT
jgi:hypothetical protein